MAWEASMDRFVNRQNIERYRRLAIETTNATERLQIMNLLAEEEAKFKLELRTAMLRRGAATGSSMTEKRSNEALTRNEGIASPGVV
jgi:hypothetical protein